MDNPCEWCNDTSKRIDSLEFELEAKDKVINKYKLLYAASTELKADLLMRGRKEKNEDGSTCTVVEVSSGRWIMFNEALCLLTTTDKEKQQ